jgi:hypothetical protein
MIHSAKLAILQSLDSMDQGQMEQVLHYLRGLLAHNQNLSHRSFKTKAMKEIRKALRIEKKVAVHA